MQPRPPATSMLTRPGNLRRIAWGVFGVGLLIVLGEQAGNWVFWIAQLERRLERDRAAAPIPYDAEKEKKSDAMFPGVEPKFLAAVKDAAPFTRKEEYDAFYHLFRILENTKTSQLEEFLQETQNDRFVSYSQLFRQPEYYRGRLVRLRGTAKGVFEQRLPKNDYGIEKYYQIWTSVGDGDEIVLVAALHLPEGMPLSTVHPDGSYEQTAEPISVVGFAYKLVLYPAAGQDVLHAPMLLARTVQWTPLPKGPDLSRRADPTTMWLAIAGSAIAAGVFTAGISLYLRRQSRRQAAKWAALNPSPIIDPTLFSQGANDDAPQS